MREKAYIDIETKDPNLKAKGAGTFRKDGFILGVGIYVPTRNIHDYYRVTDPIVKEVLEDKTLDKVAHNALYDFDWLVNGYGFKVRGRIEDTMTREALLNPHAKSYSLDACCERHNVLGKNKADTIDRFYKGKGQAIQHLDELPFGLVGIYCKQDCKACADLYKAQEMKLAIYNLQNVYNVECDIMSWLLLTKKNGMIVDNVGLKALSDDFHKELDKYTAYFKKNYGEVNINSGKQLETLFKKFNVPIEYTEKGNASFTADVLQKTNHDIAKTILNIRGVETILNTFIDGQLKEFQVDGRLHPTLYPAKCNEGGTVTGRFSCAYPNGQNIPSRADKHGHEIRALFIPEQDCMLGAFDYKQIEYRIFLHYASTIIRNGEHLPDIERIVQEFKVHDIDYHKLAQQMMKWYFPEDKEKNDKYRKITKGLNFGSIYGMFYTGIAHKFRAQLLEAHPNVPDNDESVMALAKLVYDEYFRRLPFIKPCCEMIQKTYKARGYVTSLAGRRVTLAPNFPATYPIVNYLVQGTAADVIKKAIAESYKAGIWNVLKSHIMVHDELVFSIPQTKEGIEACEELKNIMVNVYPMNIPLGVDTEIGKHWGDCNEENYKKLKQKVLTA